MSYSYYTAIDAQASAIGSDESNFPVALTVTDARFGQDGEVVGGHVQNVDASGGASGSVTVPADFVASPNNDGSSPYDFEVVSYTKTSGQIELWVEVTSLSSSVDTTIYFCYGDSGVTTSQEDVAGTWGNGFEGVWHFGEASGTLYDSVNSNDGTANGNPSYDQTGAIGDALDFDGTGDYINCGDSASLDITGNITISLWANMDSEADAAQVLIDKTGTSGANKQYFILYDNRTAQGSPDRLRFQHGEDDSVPRTNRVDWSPADITSLTMIHAVWDGSDYYIYADGSEAAKESGPPDSIEGNALDLHIADYTSHGLEFAGLLDEVMIASVARDSDWIATSYTNQSDPTPSSTFWGALGSEVGGGYTLTAAQGTLSLTGKAAGLLVGRKLTAAQGTYTLTGKDASPLAGRKLTADQGTYSLTGKDAGLAANRKLAATQGSYTLTGKDADLLSGRKLAAAQGAYSLTGKDADVLAGRKLGADQGTYTLTGKDGDLLAARKLAAAQGSYTLAGEDSELLAGRKLTAGQGTYTLTGKDAALLAGFLLTAAQGSYSLTGKDATLTADRKLTAASGSYTLSGQDAELLAARVLTAEYGTYSVAGKDADVLRGYLLTAASGSYTLDGKDAGLTLSRLLTAATGAYTLTGKDVTFLVSTPTPDARIFVVVADDRVYVVAAESRIHAIRAESRIHAVESEDRTEAIRAEQRAHAVTD